MKKVLTVLMLVGIFGGARASVIDIIEQADGSFNILSDGAQYGQASTRAAAEKVAQKLGATGNTVNWKWFSKATPSPTATTFNASKALPPASAQKALPAASTTPQKALPPAGGGTTPPVSAAPKVNVGGVAVGAVGVIAGAIGLYDSVESKDSKATLGDVGEGALSGATFAAGAASIVNAIPVGGQIAYGAAMAVGTVIGASGAAAKMFSETDCDMDPVTGQYACCNVSNLTNIQARYCNIGDEMFAEFPYVRTCMQGKNKFESNWFKARFLDDHWSDTGEVKFCSGYVMPSDGDYKIQAYGSSEAEGKVCWKWECADAGYTRRGSKCVLATQDSDATTESLSYSHVNEDEAVVIQVQSIKVGDPCPSDRLPQYATAGIYIKNGKNPDTGLDKFVCAATACQAGTYLVKNDKCQSQGWCRAGTEPDTCAQGAAAGTGTVGNAADTDDAAAENGAPNSADVAAGADPAVEIAPDAAENIPQQNVVANNCEMGVAGYVIYNGRCITDAQRQSLEAARIAAAEQARKENINRSSANIKSAFSKIEDFSSEFETTVWKDKDGNFNTSRLVSDSVAGVVLGTAGGLITSSVVKKNQVKNGFEDIKCTIGGQTVADWGDSFIVGIQ